MTNELLIASSVLQWVALCAGGVVLLGIARQVGLLHERSAPLGAMITDHGPGVGDKAPSFSIIDVKGQKRQVGGEDPAGPRLRDEGADLAADPNPDPSRRLPAAA